MTVLPLERGGNVPHRHLLGRGWTRRSVGTSDPANAWVQWGAEPFANIGVVNGSRSRVLILDGDRKKPEIDGVANFETWCAQNGVPLDAVGVERTPNDGRHWMWRWPAGAADLRSLIGWLPGVDVPWQVAVSPSARRMPGGGSWRSYEWVAGDPADLPPAPDRLMNALSANQSQWGAHEPSSDRGLTDAAALTDGLPQGSRNNEMHRLACRWWRIHWDRPDLVWALASEAWGKTSDTADFPWREAARCVESAQRFVAERRREELERWLAR
jgi:hypothetical protein